LDRKEIIGVAAALGVVCCWSGWIVVSRMGVTHTLTVYDVAGLRFAVGAMIVTPWVLRSRTWRGLTPSRVLVLNIGSGIPYAMLTYFGFALAPAAHGGVFLNGFLPISTTIVAWIWLKQRSHLSQVAGLGIILLGVFLVGYEGFTSPAGARTWQGDLVFLTAISLFAVFMVATRVWQVTPGQIVFSITLLGAVIYVPIWLLWLDSNLGLAPRSEIILQGLYQGVVPSVLGISCLSVAIRNLGATAASVFVSSVPVVAALLAIPILNEVPGPPAWIGMITVTTGVLLALDLFRSKRGV